MTFRFNVYTCQTCKRKVITVDIDEGATPFMVGCNEMPLGESALSKSKKICKGTMHSSFYSIRPDDKTLMPTFEFYKPDSTKGLSLGMTEHVKLGGLVLRPIPEDHLQDVWEKWREL